VFHRVCLTGGEFFFFFFFFFFFLGAAGDKAAINEEIGDGSGMYSSYTSSFPCKQYSGPPAPLPHIPVPRLNSAAVHML
jgi:hypothetical protein